MRGSNMCDGLLYVQSPLCSISAEMSLEATVNYSSKLTLAQGVNFGISG